MGVYRPVIEKFQSSAKTRVRPTSEKKVTLANAMSAARPILGAVALTKLIKGKDGALIYAAAGAGTDMEGFGARLWDKAIAKLGEVATVPEVLKDRGTTVHGEKLDPAADLAFAAEMAVGIVCGKKTSLLAKAAAALSMRKGYKKATWYAETDKAYQRIREERGLETEKLALPVDIAGKEATVEEMMGLTLAAATSKIKNPVGRFVVGACALVHVLVADKRSEVLGEHYAQQANTMIAAVQAGEIDTQENFAFTAMPLTPVFGRSSRERPALP